MTMRLGFSHAAGTYPNRSDFLQYGASQGVAVNSKMRAMKLLITDSYVSKYPNQSWSGTYSTLATLASDPGFTTVFNNSQLQRFYIATYTFVNTSFNKWAQSLSPNQAGIDLQAEYTDTYNLASYLLATFPGKSFVLTTLESDWEIMKSTPASPQTFDVDPALPRYARAFFQNRQRAIEDARRDVTSTAEVLHAVEVNRVRDRNTFRIHRDVLPYVGVELITMSAYESINDWLTADLSQSDLESSITENMRGAARDIRAYNPGVRLSLTDWGWPETMARFVSLGYTMPGLIQAMLDVAEEVGCEDAVYWQVFSNDSPYRQQALYTEASDGAVLTGAGTYFAGL